MEQRQQQARDAASMSSKKIRMTMACERCRSKKVKCDFAHPSCLRCQQAKAECSYGGSDTQVDLFNLVKLNDTVDTLQEQVRSIESNLESVCSDTRYMADELRHNRQEWQSAPVSRASAVTTVNNTSNAMHLRSVDGVFSSLGQPQWSLSLTPRGLRIDTNLISLHGLYDILLTGMSSLDLECNEPTLSSHSSSVSTPASGDMSKAVDKTTIARRAQLWKSKLKTFPLYSTWDVQPTATQQRSEPDPHLSHETLEEMMTIYCQCFLCLPCAHNDGNMLERYQKGTLDPMLANAVCAWTARHGAIYHNLFHEKDPNQVGEVFFERAKEMLKDRFMAPTVDTMHSLLIMYIYATGRPAAKYEPQCESEAYIYLGLAVRMGLDLKMHQESMSSDPMEQERNRRFFWVLYLLETLCSIHSDRPFSLPPSDEANVSYPTVMKSEMQDEEVRWRVEFMTNRFRITRIYRDIILETVEENPLLSTISALDKELEDWYEALPSYFRYDPATASSRDWKSASFREHACLKLNFEYNFQRCQLYGLFTSRPNSGQPPSAIDLLAKDVCLRAANLIVELFECWCELPDLWCHFSLETLMIATAVYGNVLSHATDASEMDAVKHKLRRMATLLSNSPVHHHRHVIELVSKMQSLLVDTQTHSEEPPVPTPTSAPASTPSSRPTSKSPEQPQTIQVKSQSREQPQGLAIMHHTPMIPTSSVLDVAPASSIFDLHKMNSFAPDYMYTHPTAGYPDTSTMTMRRPPPSQQLAGSPHPSAHPIPSVKSHEAPHPSWIHSHSPAAPQRNIYTPIVNSMPAHTVMSNASVLHPDYLMDPNLMIEPPSPTQPMYPFRQEHGHGHGFNYYG